MNTFTDLRVIVTGGASGIGAAVTSQLLARGARVAVLDLTVDTVADGAIGQRCDVSDRSSVQSAVDVAPRRWAVSTSSSTTPAWALWAPWLTTTTTSGSASWT